MASDPYPHYEELRGKGPVHFLPHHDAWILLSHEAAQFAFAHPVLFSNRPYQEVDAVLLAADPPEHALIRRIVSRYLSAETLESLCASAALRAQALLKPRMDVVDDFGVPLSQSVAAQLVGLDEKAVSAIRSVHAETPELGPYTRALDAIASRAVIYRSFLGDGLADREARSLVRLLWLATTTTTERVIARCVLRLLQHADVRTALEHDRSLVGAFVDEVLRLHPPELLVPRLTTQEVRFGDVTIPQGALVHICVAAANRDPLRFEDPASLKLDRPAVRHFSFGSGIHHCLGAMLARRQLITAVTTMLTRAPAFRAVHPLHEVAYWSTMTANAIEHLVVDTGTFPGERP